MRNLLAFLALVVLVFAGAGWYLGWYKVEKSSPQPGHQSIKVDVDTNKITDDLKRGEQRVHRALESGTKEEGSKPSTDGDSAKKE